MEIKFEDYLSDEQIREILRDELRLQVRKHFDNEENSKRLLSNLAYHIVKEEIEKIVPDYEVELIKKVSELITDEKSISFNLFDFDTYGTGRGKSLGAKIVEQTVEANKQLIKDKVVEAIQNRDYSEEALIKLEHLSEEFTSNIFDFVELIRSRKDD